MKLPPPLEKYVQAQLVQYLRLTGYVVWEMYKGSDRGGSAWMTPGVPDLYVFGHGKAFWCEVKRPKLGRLSPAQVQRHDELRQNGIPAHIITNLEELQAALGAP